MKRPIKGQEVCECRAKIVAVFRRLQVQRPRFASCFADIQKERPNKLEFFS